jgi:hypothetical protein
VEDEPESDAFLDLCVRYLAGESEREDHTLLASLLKDGDRFDCFMELRRTWDSLRPMRHVFDAGPAFARLKLAGVQALDTHDPRGIHFCPPDTAAHLPKFPMSPWRGRPLPG